MLAARRRGRRDQGGQILLAFALSFGLLLFGLFAAVLDLDQEYAAKVNSREAAEAAARSGASQVTAQSVEANSPALASNFQGVCQSAGDTFAHATGATQCDVIPGTTNGVRATVTIRVNPAIPIFGASFTVSSVYQAAPVEGGLRPSGP